MLSNAVPPPLDPLDDPKYYLDFDYCMTKLQDNGVPNPKKNNQFDFKDLRSLSLKWTKHLRDTNFPFLPPKTATTRITQTILSVLLKTRKLVQDKHTLHSAIAKYGNDQFPNGTTYIINNAEESKDAFRLVLSHLSTFWQSNLEKKFRKKQK